MLRLSVEHTRIPREKRISCNEKFMPICETCGNDYNKAFELIVEGESHIFD